MVYGGTELKGGHYSLNGSGGAAYLPTVGRNTLRLPDRMNLDLRFGRAVRLGERLRIRAAVEVFNLANRVNDSGVETRAYLVGTKVAAITPLIFQSAATVATEGLNVRPFGTFTAASSTDSQQRQVQLSLRAEF
jgi:hypothetical protein